MFMKSLVRRRTFSLFIILLATAFLVFWVAGCKKNKDEPANVTPNIKLVAENLVSPLSVVESPDDSKRLFIVDQAGKIWIIPPGATMLTTPFLDLSGKIVSLNASYDERGLLSMAFHPNFKTNGKFYVFYTAPPRAGGPSAGVNWNSLTRISEFKVSAANSNVADMSSEKVILEADHPQSNHNGGTVAFGPDGFLYISIGDGGNKDDVGAGHFSDWYTANIGGNAQNLWANLMGKVLRIDVNNGTPYSIPADNPFAGSPNFKKEIYAYGFRNPYRFSFDMGGTHQLYLGDAGQSLYEEVDIVTKGSNYGWNVKEGTVCFNTDSDLLVRPNCPSVDSLGKPLVDPIIQLINKANPSGGGTSLVVVGGNVYRGTAFPNLQGKYIFGSFASDFANPDGQLYVSSPSTNGMWTFEDFKPKDFPNNLGYFLKGFGQDLSGEIYIAVSAKGGVSGTTGKIYKIVPAQ
jgi:glucose/arabinose dehydrogenase